MKLNIKVLLVLLLFLFCLMANYPLSAQLSKVIKAKRIQNAAIKGLNFWIKVIPGNDIKKHGFSNQAQLSKVTLGPSIQLCTLQSERILNYHGETIEAMISNDSKRWYFPVIAEGKYRTILIVAQRGSEFKAVGLGYKSLAQELQTIRTKWPTNKGYNAKLLRVLQPYSDFVLLQTNGRNPRLVPLDSANRALGLKVKNSAYEPKHLISELQRVLKKQPPKKNLNLIKNLIKKQ